ncbi:DNA-binding response regulator MtrA [bacterium BMS3Abin05]|nr:DNA-binding response regulator MtrA [bacterium BMS3Abin05]GBE26805.1 DNA-binding response regulator MtrA [bacterium BMS3Bbin03]HDZ13085.1 response regulator [Bacteroidota bacterium]
MEKKRILVVDDYPQVVEALKIRLESVGYEVLTAYDGQEALNVARNEKPDLILLDVLLPKINGYKVARFLKFDKKYKNIPIIMLTSRAKKTDAELGRHSGADEYVYKPYNPPHLLQMIRKYTGG